MNKTSGSSPILDKEEIDQRPGRDFSVFPGKCDFPIFDTIVRMYRMRSLLRLLDKYPYLKSMNNSLMYQAYREGVPRNQFLLYAEIIKGFGMSWSDRIVGIGRSVHLVSWDSTPAGVARALRQQKLIEHVIEDCKSKGYLDSNSSGLKITALGARFIDWTGFKFVSELLSDNMLMNIIIGAVIGTSITLLLK